jgi:hypothetical protein
VVDFGGQRLGCRAKTMGLYGGVDRYLAEYVAISVWPLHLLPGKLEYDFCRRNAHEEYWSSQYATRQCYTEQPVGSSAVFSPI